MLIWRETLLERLLDSVSSDGAWAYRASGSGAAEPTALSCLAIRPAERSGAPADETLERGLTWLADQQRDGGAVPVAPNLPGPNWTTAHAILAWRTGVEAGADRFRANVTRAADWLLRQAGQTTKANADTHDHNTELVGWSWVDGTHSWVEPTALAVLALRAAGYADHPRVAEGVALLRNRALPDGGWNYGNRRVLSHVLRPFQATTGVALCALAGMGERDECITSALEYVAESLPSIRASLSLAWGVLGLRAWDAAPSDMDTWLEACAARLVNRPWQNHYAAMLVLAGAERCPLLNLEVDEAEVPPRA